MFSWGLIKVDTEQTRNGGKMDPMRLKIFVEVSHYTLSIIQSWSHSDALPSVY
jgi:hypothetical protein